jgi:heme exporter protein D
MLEASARMSTLSDYLHMGGYAFYVWGAYGLAAIILVGLLLVSWRGLRVREAEITRLQAGRPRRPSRSTSAGSPSRQPQDESSSESRLS